MSVLFAILVLCCLLQSVISTELTFELPDNGKECFYEEIKANTTANIEFQVVTGGQYDVDVVLLDPRQKELYKQVKTQFDSHQFTAQSTGIYSMCFSNEFSTFSHKIVYMDFQIGDEAPLPGVADHVTALTQMETAAVDTHKYLNLILDLQTHYRLREAQGRKRAEDLNEKVLWWSLMETAAIISICTCQTIMLKSFFSEKRPLGR